MKRRNARILLAPAAAVEVALSSCIEFKSQTMSWYHDEASDSLLIHQRYEGIFGADRTEELTAKERGELVSVLTGEHTFFFSNWILELDVAALRAEAREAAAESGPGAAEVARACQLVADNVRVSNGPFYLDDGGRLCGVQRIVLTNVSAVVTAINAACRAQAVAEADDEGKSGNERTFLRAIAGGLPCVELKGGWLRLRLPLGKDESAEQATEGAAEVEEAGGRLEIVDRVQVLSFGDPDVPRQALALPVSASDYRPNAVEFVRQRFGIAEAFDPEADLAAFFARLEGKP